MLYLLDSDVMIRAKRDHYRFATFPSFWEYLRSAAVAGSVRIIERIREETMEQEDELSAWIEACPPACFGPADAATLAAAPAVTAWAEDPTHRYSRAARDEFLSGRGDYWLTAHALGHRDVVVTMEQSAPTAVKSIKLPDACAGVGVRCINPFKMLEELGARF